MPEKEWFRKWFNSPYYDLLYRKRNDEEAKDFIASLINYLQPLEGSRMLDVACGKGRHCRALAAMGFDVTGFDLSEQVILEAKKYENENLHFYLHDMRLPFWINYFGYAFNFFTSFGYFNTQREHDDAMRTITQSLRPNGIFVIDYLNVHFAEDCLVKSEKLEINDSIFNITRHYDEQHFYKQIQVENQNGTVDDVFTERITKFSLGDFIDMLAYQEMQIKDVFGDYLLSHYDIRKSPRMIIVAEKKVRKVN